MIAKTILIIPDFHCFCKLTCTIVFVGLLTVGNKIGYIVPCTFVHSKCSSDEGILAILSFSDTSWLSEYIHVL